jgi:hypothetical protein
MGEHGEMKRFLRVTYLEPCVLALLEERSTLISRKLPCLIYAHLVLLAMCQLRGCRGLIPMSGMLGLTAQ